MVWKPNLFVEVFPDRKCRMYYFAIVISRKIMSKCTIRLLFVSYREIFVIHERSYDIHYLVSFNTSIFIYLFSWFIFMVLNQQIFSGRKLAYLKSSCRCTREFAFKQGKTSFFSLCLLTYVETEKRITRRKIRSKKQKVSLPGQLNHSWIINKLYLKQSDDTRAKLPNFMKY